MIKYKNLAIYNILDQINFLTEKNEYKLSFCKDNVIKFQNYILFIDTFLDQILNMLLVAVYSSDFFEESEREVFEEALRVLIYNLTFFENFLLDGQTKFVIGTSLSFADLSLAISIHKAFQFFVGEKVRKNFPNCQRFFLNIINEPQIQRFYTPTKLCHLSYQEQFFPKQPLVLQTFSKPLWTFKTLKDEFLNGLVQEKGKIVVPEQKVFAWSFEYIQEEEGQHRKKQLEALKRLIHEIKEKLHNEQD